LLKFQTSAPHFRQKEKEESTEQVHLPGKSVVFKEAHLIDFFISLASLFKKG
jgi:hypothetical protein